MLTLGIILTVSALALLLLGLRGRVVARGVFCRRCNFDLAGLDGVPACPECGRVSPSADRPRTVLRRRSPGRLFAGVLCLILGGGLITLGAARPASIYPRLPEVALITLDGLGVDDALIELHDRLAVGVLSDHSFQRMTERALARALDRSPRWSPLRGDFLAVAMQRRRLTDDQIGQLAEAAFTFRTEIRPVIDRSDTMIWYRIQVAGTPWTSSVLGGRIRTQRTAIPSPYRIEIGRAMPWFESKPPRHTFPITGGQAFISDWIPGEVTYWDALAGLPLRKDAPETDSIQEVLKLTLSVDDRVIHTWEVATQAEFALGTNVGPHASPIFDENSSGLRAASFAESLTVGWVEVPVERDEGRRHRETEDCYWSRTIRIRETLSPTTAGDACLFELFVRCGGEEIPFAEYESAMGGGMDIDRDRGLERSMLDYFDRYAGFWQQAVDHGSVDLILRPKPSLANRDPQYKRYANAAIIFRDVPLMIRVPRDTGRASPGGTTWDWVQQDPRSYQILRGKLLNE